MPVFKFEAAVRHVTKLFGLWDGFWANAYFVLYSTLLPELFVARIKSQSGEVLSSNLAHVKLNALSALSQQLFK